MPTINMKSTATKIKGQGVGSCYEEQVELVSNGLSQGFDVVVNKFTKTDIYHFHTINLNFYFERLLTKNKSAGIGYVHFLPDTLDESLKLPYVVKKIVYNYLLVFYNSMDYLVVVNPDIIEKLKLYGVTKPKIIYIPNFVSEKNFYEQNEEEILGTKLKMNIKRDKFVVLGAGQLQSRKGVLDFIETAKLLPDVQFIWAGGFSFGKITDGYEKIKKAVNNSPKNIIFTGIVERTSMVDLYNIADIMFLPSFDELFPMCILEAIACKTPILLRDIPVYHQILFDNYLKGKSVGDFVDIIKDLKNDKDKQEDWKDKTWKCHKFYSEKAILNQWENLYKEASMKPKASVLPNIKLRK